MANVEVLVMNHPNQPYPSAFTRTTRRTAAIWRSCSSAVCSFTNNLMTLAYSIRGSCAPGDDCTIADVTDAFRPRGGLGLDALMTTQTAGPNGQGVNGLKRSHLDTPCDTGGFRIRLIFMADKKLPFHVVFASGEDPQYPASELNVHSSKVLCSVSFSA
jgi:hypothetical protein